MNDQTRVCDFCSVSFVTRRDNQKFCTTPCRLRHRERKPDRRAKSEARYKNLPASKKQECQARYRDRHPDRVEDRRLRVTYGISLAQYESLVVEQGGACAICGLRAKRNKLHVDHDHETGLIRGLCCTNCNMAMGLFRDNIESLLRAVEYLRSKKVLHVVAG